MPPARSTALSGGIPAQTVVSTTLYSHSPHEGRKIVLSFSNCAASVQSRAVVSTLLLLLHKACMLQGHE